MISDDAKQVLELVEPALRKFAFECAIAELPQRSNHRVSIHLLCVELDDLIWEIIAIEKALGNRVTIQTPRQTGRGWVAKGTIKA